ncbi:MAG TPA: hypothetical protein PKV40_04110, partial [Candidatus Kapabacteria bacterium]|nr:hypothetical protein [Candidatus Kapabacteria bacterium]
MTKESDGNSDFWAYKSEHYNQDEQLILLDNVQFIYELALAQLELQSLGVNFKITNGLRKFNF